MIMKTSLRTSSCIVGAFAALMLLSSCQTSQKYSGDRVTNLPHSRPESWDGEGAFGSMFPQSSVAESSRAAERSGLGTKWGETRTSSVVAREFSRGGRSRPWASGSFFYNDESGAKAMANLSGFAWRRTGPFTMANNTLSVGLKSGHGGFLKSFSSGSDRFYVGEKGDRYVIWIKNLTPSRLEVVVSVDGLDVLDGEAASYRKRGHLIQPNSTLTIDGFRRSSSAVAAFRFSSVADSYSERRHGNSRNVGVIGVGVFPEDGANPFRGEIHKRISADPFPREFAKPPSR